MLVGESAITELPSFQGRWGFQVADSIKVICDAFNYEKRGW